MTFDPHSDDNSRQYLRLSVTAPPPPPPPEPPPPLVPLEPEAAGSPPTAAAASGGGGGSSDILFLIGMLGMSLLRRRVLAGRPDRVHVRSG